MNSNRHLTENRPSGQMLLAPANICLLFVANSPRNPEAEDLRTVALSHQWLILDVELIEAEHGPWIGAAMPGSANGCGLFAGTETRSYRARTDMNGVYLSATADALLSSNGVRDVHLLGAHPESFAKAMRSFSIAHDYRFHLGPPAEGDGSIPNSTKSFVRDFASRVSSKETALVLIDFQNDFCDAKGATGRTGASMAMIDAAVNQCRDLLQAARRRGLFVVHVRAEYGSPWRSPSSPFRFPVNGRREPAVWTASAADMTDGLWFGEGESEVCHSGSWGAEFVEGLSPRAGEAVITKHRFGAFAGTGLDQLLRAQRISNLIVAGVTTNCCVETTAREAVMREFSLVIVEDCVAVKDHLADLHRATLESLGSYFGLVRPAADITSEWERDTR
jgi:nicotinamidase-related amidase